MNIELIGKKVEVQGINGIIVDETKYLITIKTKKGNKMIQKNQATFRVWNGEVSHYIEGKMLEERPEERITLR